MNHILLFTSDECVERFVNTPINSHNQVSAPGTCSVKLSVVEGLKKSPSISSWKANHFVLKLVGSVQFLFLTSICFRHLFPPCLSLFTFLSVFYILFHVLYCLLLPYLCLPHFFSSHFPPLTPHFHVMSPHLILSPHLSLITSSPQNAIVQL